MNLRVDPEKCSGCRLCETACTHAHDGNYGSRSARVRVSKIESIGIDYPVMCQLCKNPACVRACPIGALTQDPDTGVIQVDEDRCTGDGRCVQACPFGACNLHPQKKVAIICDRCGGQPACVQECPTGTITIEDRSSRTDFQQLAAGAQKKRDEFAQRMCRTMLEKWGDR